MGIISSVKSKIWPESGMRKRMRLWKNQLVNRVSKKSIVAGLRDLGVKEGDILCVHSSLASIGYVPGGGIAVIDAMFEAVGGPQKGTIMMPTFSMSGSMKNYLEKKDVIDLRFTPSMVGSLTETFRTMEGVKRSAHPTHSVAAKGFMTDYLIEDNEKEVTPFADGTPWGRWPELDNSYILLINTHFLTIIHVAQEQMNYPVFYEPDSIKKVRFINAEGKTKEMETRVMIPKLPYHIPLPKEGKLGEKPFLHLNEYPYRYPFSSMSKFEGTDYYTNNIKTWHSKEQEMKDLGIIEESKIGQAKVALVKAKACLEYMKKDLLEMTIAVKELMTPEYIKELVPLYKNLLKQGQAAKLAVKRAEEEYRL